ncbi:hypothetical protein BH23CHL5_BH23CHL5_18060 [soil metagenome]
MDGISTLLARTDHDQPSVFMVENLLREGRRQLDRAEVDIPRVCLLDPDGDVVRFIEQSGIGAVSPGWACYHTTLFECDVDDLRIGVLGCAVGGSFAVLVAEELFASGCNLVVSLTSAGRIGASASHEPYVIIDRALRGEGTSYAYLPPAPAVCADASLAETAHESLVAAGIAAIRGTSWTTDAPFRETASAIADARRQGAIAVEMEAASLYALASARGFPLLCLAHLTNDMAVEPGDFEKGAANGAEMALHIVSIISRALGELVEGVG